MGRGSCCFIQRPVPQGKGDGVAWLSAIHKHLAGPLSLWLPGQSSTVELASDRDRSEPDWTSLLSWRAQGCRLSSSAVLQPGKTPAAWRPLRRSGHTELGCPERGLAAVGWPPAGPCGSPFRACNLQGFCMLTLMLVRGLQQLQHPSHLGENWREAPTATACLQQEQWQG